MKIEFIPTSQFAADVLEPPVPAKTVLPEWYKKTPFLTNNNSSYNFSETGVLPTTIKGCNPFLDGLTSGYISLLSVDVEIKKEGEKRFSFFWRTDNEVITSHTKDQHPFTPAAFNGDDSIFKFFNEFIIRTPKGYSTYFTHPINRHDLPFRTFSGVVDTDTYMNSVQFPAQLLDMDSNIMVLKKGTPICQFFPFKRVNWESNVLKYDESFIKKARHNYFSRIYRAYKSLHWKRKTYK